MTLGENIKKKREEAGLSQDELAQKLGYKSRSTIAKVEADVNDLNQTKLKAFATALGTTVTELLDFDKDSDPQAYYLDPETARMVQELKDHPGQRVLFDASRDLKPEDVQIVLNLINGLKAKEGK